LIDNNYITGVHSSNSSTIIIYDIYIYLPYDYDSHNDLYSILNDQLKLMEIAGYPTSPAGLEAIKITADTNTTPTPGFGDEEISSNTHILPAILSQCPGKFTLTLPTTSPASYGLLLLTSRHAKWSAPIPEANIPTQIPTDIRNILIKQIPIIIRSNTSTSKPSRDPCSLYNPAFANRPPTECLRNMRTAVMHTLLGLLTTKEYRRPHDNATIAAHLSLQTQALLQAFDSSSRRPDGSKRRELAL